MAGRMLSFGLVAWSLLVPAPVHASPDAYRHLGCYGDTPTRAMPVVTWEVSDRSSPAATIEECYQLAKAAGMVVFGVEFSHQCFASNDCTAYSLYGHYMHAYCETLGSLCSQCESGIGGAWSMDVYVIRDSPCVCAQDTSIITCAPCGEGYHANVDHTLCIEDGQESMGSGSLADSEVEDAIRLKMLIADHGASGGVALLLLGGLVVSIVTIRRTFGKREGTKSTVLLLRQEVSVGDVDGL